MAIKDRTRPIVTDESAPEAKEQALEAAPEVETVARPTLEAVAPPPGLANQSQAFAFLEGLRFAQRALRQAPDAKAGQHHLDLLVEETRGLINTIRVAEEAVVARLRGGL